MYSMRSNGDSIAHEFNKLMGNGQILEKVAEDQTNVVNDAVVNDAEDQVRENDITDNMLSDMLVDNAEDEAGDASGLEGQISDMVDYAEDQSKVASDENNSASNNFSDDPSGQYIMNGLGKIAASLRAKGEGFAADVVEVTAFGIREDLVKEANRKSDLVFALNKMAKDFRNNGDNFAGDMVTATINKIR